MTNYVLVYSGGGAPESEAEQAKVMAAWGAWMSGLGDALVDGGNPFGGVKNIQSDGSVSEGPIGNTPASGYSIISADSLDAAVEMAKGCPILEGNGQISVYETFQM